VKEPYELESFPCVYTFKVFGRSSETFVERVREIVELTLGRVPLDSMKVRRSAHGRYLSVTILARVHSRDQLERVYEDLRAEREVLLYI
jgi:putative lipoic acid-binding regulatory protein